MNVGQEKMSAGQLKSTPLRQWFTTLAAHQNHRGRFKTSPHQTHTQPAKLTCLGEGPGTKISISVCGPGISVVFKASWYFQCAASWEPLL